MKATIMKNSLKAEQAMQLILAILALNIQPLRFAWWQWPLLFLSPDLSMVGYLVGPRAGAVFYNIAHHKAIAGAAVLAGYAFSMPVVFFCGLLLWGHSSFDRMMGYGLKYPDSFNHTHLGMIGKAVKG
jgi:hypothetical protein